MRPAGRKIGTGIVLCTRQLVLLGLRQGVELWELPGGGQEGQERCEAAGLRELREETGIELQRLDFCGYHDSLEPDWISLVFGQLLAEPIACRLELVSPQEHAKHACWHWQRWSQLPPLTPVCNQALALARQYYF